MKLKRKLKALEKAIQERGFRALAARALVSAVALSLLMAGLCPANAGEPCHWERKPNKPAPFQFDTYHGETIDFRCTFVGFSSLPFGSGDLSPRLYYQTNGMAAAWWDIPATVSTTVVTNCQPPITNYSLSAVFPPAADPGAERLTVFFGAPSNAYAAAQVRFRNSPGPFPNTLAPPSILDWHAELSSATNALAVSLSSQMSKMSQSATNYTDSATNATTQLLMMKAASSQGESVLVANALVKDGGSTRVTRIPTKLYVDVSIPGTISNTVTKAYVESLGIESGVDAQTVTNMTALTPVYGGNGERFSEWTILRTYDGTTSNVTSNIRQPEWYETQVESFPYWIVNTLEQEGDSTAIITSGIGENADGLEWIGYVGGYGSEEKAIYAATRTENPIIGYVLGTQTNSVLASTNSIISASTVTNIAFAVSADATNSLAKSFAPTVTNLAPTRAEVEAGWWSGWTAEFYTGSEWVGIDDPSVQEEIVSASLAYDVTNGWRMTLTMKDGGGVRELSPSSDAHDENATRLGFSILGGDDVVRATRHRVAAPVPTKPSDIGAQPVLTFDTTPTAGSTNPVTSAGIKTALENKQVTIQIGGGNYTTVNDVVYIPSDNDGSSDNPYAVVLNSALVSTTNSIAKSLAPTITNIASTVSSSAIASADTTYRRTIGLTNLNQSVQYVNITDTSPTTLAISMPTDGATKDWMVYVVSVTNVTLSLPAATYWMADTAYTNEVPPATPTALWFSQVTDGVFLLGRQELTPVSIEGGN